MTTITEEDNYQYGDKVKWMGTLGTIEGKVGPSCYLVWTGSYLVQAWESDLTKVGTST